MARWICRWHNLIFATWYSQRITVKITDKKNRLALTSLFLKSLSSTTSNSVTSCLYWLAFVSVRITSCKSDQPALNSGAGLGIEDCFYHDDIILLCLVWWKMYPLLYPQSLLQWKRNQTRELGDEVKGGTHILVHFSMCYLWFLPFPLLYTHSAINCSAGSGGA